MTMHRHIIHAFYAVLLLGLWLGLGLPAHAKTDTVYVYYTDPQGTPLAKADIHGNIIARYDYTPYGSSVTSLSSPPNGPGYTGHVNDPESGLVYMQQRYYDPVTGRFLSPDPVTTYSNPLGAFNRYWYASNNPISHNDPDGRQTIVTGAAAGCAITGPACPAGAIAGVLVGAAAGAAIYYGGKYLYHHTMESKEAKDTGSSSGGNKESQRPSKTPNTGDPGTKYKNPGSGQEREYGSDGKPTKDIDHDHDHGQGTPHVHDWGRDSDGNPVRGPGRPINPETEPHIAPNTNIPTPPPNVKSEDQVQ